MDEAIEMFKKSMSDEVSRLKFKYKQAEQNYWDAKKLGDQKRMEACEKLKIINDTAIASIEWAITVLKWHKDEIELNQQLELK